MELRRDKIFLRCCWPVERKGGATTLLTRSNRWKTSSSFRRLLRLCQVQNSAEPLYFPSSEKEFESGRKLAPQSNRLLIDELHFRLGRKERREDVPLGAAIVGSSSLIPCCNCTRESSSTTGYGQPICIGDVRNRVGPLSSLFFQCIIIAGPIISSGDKSETMSFLLPFSHLMSLSLSLSTMD